MTQTSKNTGAETMPICNKLKRERLACHNGFTVTIAFITHNGAASPEGDETPLPPPPLPRHSNLTDIFQEHAHKNTRSFSIILFLMKTICNFAIGERGTGSYGQAERAKATANASKRTRQP